MREVKQYKVTTLLGNLPADSIFYLRETPESDVKVYITSRTGVPVPIKDLSGGAGITINNTDGNLTVVNGEATSINFSEEILSVINSALQTGDVVSTLINDAGYLTASDIPVSDEPYNSTTWNNVVDEAPSKNAVRDKIESLILSGGGGANLATIQTPTSVTITSDTGDNAEITLADGTNSGVSINNFTTSEKNKLNDIATNANVGVVPNAPIASSTKTKITYDAKGLVIAGADLVASDIPNIPQSKVDNLNTDLGNKQNTLGGTGFVKSTAGTISYDTNTYLTPTGSAAGLTSFPTLNQNTTGTAGGLSADIPQSRVTDLVSDLSNKQPLATVLTNTTASFTTADETKLDKYPTTATNGKMLQGDGTNYVEVDTPSGSTNLSTTYAPTTVTVVSSSGTDAEIKAVDGTDAGIVTVAQKTTWDNKQDALGFTPYNATNPSGFQDAPQVATAITTRIKDDVYEFGTWGLDQFNTATRDALYNKFELTSSELAGKQPLSSVLTATTASFTTGDKAKLDGIATGANVGVVPNTAITGATKTKITYDAKGLVTAGADATQDDILDGSTNRSFTNTEKTKLTGIATGATENSSDAILLARANHTGTQTASTISDFNSATRAQTEAELVAGTNITITPSGTGATRQLTIASTGGGGATPQTGQIIVTSGTSFTTPASITTNTVFNIELIGGGGGGGGVVTANSSGSGGGGGGYCFIRLTGLSPNTSYTCAIGSGGATATAGGNTTLTFSGTTYESSGGGAGVNAVSSAGGAGGAGGNGDINITGQSGDDSPTASPAVQSSAGGSSPKGWGLGGSGVRNTLAGKAGTGYGAGGSAGKQNATGGSGTNGIIFCQWYN